MTNYIEVNESDKIVGFSTKTNKVKEKEQWVLHMEPKKIKVSIRYKQRFEVFEVFRNLIADPLYSSGYLWGQVDPALWTKNHDDFMKYAEKGVHYLRNIILLYHIGLELEAFYLWSGFKKKRDWLKDHLGDLVEQEQEILKILDNPPFKITPKAINTKNAIEMSYAHWGRQIKFLRGHNKKEATEQDKMVKRAPWHTDTVTWNNKGQHVILGMKECQDLVVSTHETHQ